MAVVTSRPQKLEALTIDWLNKNFPNIFSEVKLGNIWALEGHSISKPEMCQMMDVKLLIDDSVRYALQCSKVGIGVLLFNEYPWNNLGELPENIYELMGGEKLRSI